MSDPFRNQPFPRGPLLGAAALVGVALLLTTVARVGDVGRTTLPTSTVVAAYELRFEDRPDGSVAVSTADGRAIGVFEPGTNGFARGALRGLTRERKREGIGPEPPFRLTRWSDGRLSLDDPATGEHVDLEVFGPTNSAAFARLWSAADAARS